MKKIILFILLNIFSSLAYSDHNMRRCTLLPITDSVGGAIAFKVFEDVESYLKESRWCLYKNNSEVINILSNYKHNLSQYLDNKDVIKVISDKLKVGSLIKVRLVGRESGIEIYGEVVGSNGEDLFFKEKAYLETDDLALIGQTIKGWMELYHKTIPYDGKITGALGEQVTVDIGKKFDIKIGQEFTVKRPIAKKKHPLLKEIVEQETINLGRGKIVNISESQALGFVGSFESERKIQAGDWIKLELEKQMPPTPKDFPTQIEKKKYAKIGTFSFGGSLTKGSTTIHKDSVTRKIGGYPLGFYGKTELWITRNYFAFGEYSKRIGNYNRKTNNMGQESYNVSMTNMKFSGGYKYLPLGFFYGPQIDFHLGYARYKVGLDTSVVEGFGEGVVKGILVGVSGNAPVYQDFRMFGRVDILPKPSYSEEQVVYGNSKDGSSIYMELGAKYILNPVMTVDGSFGITHNKVKFKSSSNEITYQDNVLNAGITYSY